jgi:tetratricopeptide (TPR) repeat protein
MLRPAIVVLLITAAHSAHPAVAAGGSEKEARALFQRAEKSFNLGRFADALTDYQAAYEAKPLPGFLFNIAQCYRNMANYERARFFYRRYLAIEPKTSNRGLVEDLIAEMTRLLDKQTAASAVAPPPAAPAAAVRAAPTPETATTPSPAPSPASSAGAMPVGGPAAALIAAPSPEGPPPRRPVYKRWWFWTAAGAAVVGGVAAAFMLTRNGQPSGSLAPIEAN